MHCTKYAKREQETPLLFKLTLRSRFKAQCVSCHKLLVMFGLSTLTGNSNRTNHKPRKKLANSVIMCPCDPVEFELNIVH